jgi:hypothetical protein
MKNRSLLKQILEETRDVWDQPGTRPTVRKNFAATGQYSVDDFPCFSFSGRSVSRIAVSLTMVRIGLDTQTSVFKAGTELLKKPIAYHR